MAFKPDVIHLEVLGQKCDVLVDVPSGDCRVTDLLPAARSLSSSLSGAAVRDAALRGRPATCAAGCGACCRQMVGVSAIEAAGLALTVNALPQARRREVASRFADAVHQLEDAGLLNRDAPKGQRTLKGMGKEGTPESGKRASKTYFSLGIACPFLENESCSIYKERPLVCREYNVSSPPERCSDIDLAGVQKIAPPVHVGLSMSRVGHKLIDTTVRVLPLTLSLEWAQAHEDELNKVIDGDIAYALWVDQLGGTLG